MFSGDGRKLVTAPVGLSLRIWDIVTGDPLAEGPILNHAPYALSHDGQLLAAGGSANEEVIDVWDLRDGRRVRSLPGRAFWVLHSAAFSPDGRTLAVGSEPWPEVYDSPQDLSETLTLWDLTSDAPGVNLKVDNFDTGPDAIQAIAFSPDGRAFVSAGRASVSLWDAVRTERIDRIPDDAHAVALTAQGSTVAFGCGDGSTVVWDPGANYRRPYRLTTSGAPVQAVAVSAGGRYVVSGTDAGALQLWDRYRGPRETHTVRTEGAAVTSLVFLADDTLFAALSADGRVEIRDPDSGTLLQTFPTRPGG